MCAETQPQYQHCSKSYTMLQDGETALFEAASSGNADVVKMLVKYGVAVDIRDKVGKSLQLVGVI